MSPHNRHPRRGMTLIELLVVIAIIGLLSAAVLPNLANSAGPRKVRETARSVSSFFAAAQSQAIGGRTGSGVWIDLLPNPIVDDTGVTHAVALDMALCDIPTPYSGEMTSSVVRVTPIPDDPDKPLSPAASTANLVFEPAGAFRPPQATNLFIRFGRATTQHLFSYDPNTPDVGLASVGNTIGQTRWNVAWPITSAAGVAYEVILPPVKNPVRSLTVETDMVIDLTWTFLGVDDGSWPPCDPTGDINVSSPVVMLYNPTGKPTTVASNGGVGVAIRQPLYLLVTSIKAIQEGTSFTTSRSYWVAVDPEGGIPRVAEVNPPFPMPVGPWVPSDRNELLNTQKFIRDTSLQAGG